MEEREKYFEINKQGYLNPCHEGYSSSKNASLPFQECIFRQCGQLTELLLNPIRTVPLGMSTPVNKTFPVTGHLINNLAIIYLVYR